MERFHSANKNHAVNSFGMQMFVLLSIAAAAIHRPRLITLRRATATTALGFGLSLEQRLRSQTGSRAAAAVAPGQVRVITRTRPTSITCCADAEDTEPLAAYAFAASPAVVAVCSGQPLFAAVLVPLLALSRAVQAPPAAALLVAPLLYDGGATLIGEPAGALVANTACSLACAALSLRVADDARQASAVVRLPEKELSPEELELLETKREALRQRKSWDARLQWRERKRGQGAGKDEESRL